MADTRSVEKRILGLAEQLGRLIGTVERKAEGLADQQTLTSQVERIRDSASELLEHLGGAIQAGRASANPAPEPPKPRASSRGAAKSKGAKSTGRGRPGG
jgi:TolA-binding protein